MLDNREGQPIPQTTFRTRKPSAWLDVTSAEIFDNRKVVVFSLPGAFTPTCSSAHVPRFNELTPVFAANGIDEVVCVSVNDAFVMDAWQQDQQADAIRFLPDGNGEFSEGMGMLVDKSDLGFGRRSWRYAMIVDNGIIEKMFIEADVLGDPFEVSDADTVLRYLNPDVKLPADVSLFSKPGCPFCAGAKDALNDHGIAFTEIVLGRDVDLRTLRAVTGSDSVPQAFVDGRHIGDSEALIAWVGEQG
jgi:glutaredoxin-like protein